ncbi:MAG: filamentous hemagglutinin N-terminal domain-containing protein, partial [Candidatus Omnitrophota bacterium]
MNTKNIKIQTWFKGVVLAQTLLFALLPLSFLVFFQGTALALPEGQTVESGEASFEYSADSTTLTVTAADQTVINFQSFNIALEEAVNFFQPSSTASVLARVLGGGPSLIAGSLSANGNLFLTNTAGINFSPTAMINVNNFVASSLDIATNNFLTGNYIFERSPGSTYAQVSNEGTMSGNNIALMGSRVKNTGLVLARVGTLHLASGDKTTVSFDSKGLINVAVNMETGSGDAGNQMIADAAIENSGTLEGKQVILEARAARGLFQNAVNQTGIVRATGMVEENGVIKIVANQNIKVSGDLEAENGKIEVASSESVEVPEELRTLGDTKIRADGDIHVYADVTTLDGDLSFLADANLDGVGSFRQAQNTTLSTVNFGDITIQSSGETTLANILSVGDLVLKPGGAPANFTQQPGSTIVTKGSIVINEGVTLNAGDTQYEIGENWTNLGNFIPGTSVVSLVSDMLALVLGSNTFNDLIIMVPGKIVKFDSEETQTILGVLTVRGAYGNLVTLGSIEPPKQWRLDSMGLIDVMFAYLGDCINIRGPPAVALHSDSSGNLTNWVVNVLWTGSGSSSNWSDANNWDTGVVPGSYSHVVFDGATGLNPHKDSLVDSAFLGSLDSLTLNGYTGTLALGRDLIMTGDMTLNTGTLSAGSQTATAGGNISIAVGAGVTGTDYSLYARYIEIKGALNASEGVHLTGLEGTTLGSGAAILVPSGHVILNSPNGDTILDTSSLIDVSAPEADIGGTVEIFGKQVILGGTRIDASGVSGGGTVLIGGDFQGQGTVPNATNTLVNRVAYIYADATGFGNGGKVIVWSDGLTSYYGHISARGGSEGGNGGFVQTSSSNTLIFNGFVDATAPGGARGTFILDPAGTSGYAASVATDRLDYNPGQLVTILGAGWQAGETVSIILHPAKEGLSDIELTAFVDANGNFSNAGFTPDESHRGVALNLTASGQSSGLMAMSRFTDAAFTASVTGNWSSLNTTWGVVGNYPGQNAIGDTVTISASAIVTLDVTPTFSIASLTLDIATGGTGNGVTFGGAYTLTVTGAISTTAPTTNSMSVIAVGTGTLNAGSIAISGGSTLARYCSVSVSTGTITTIGDITFPTATNSYLTFTGAGTLNLGGNLGAGGTFAKSTGIVNCNGSSAQTVAGYIYNVLKSNNTAGVTLVAATTITTLTIGDVTANSIFNDGGFVITPFAPSVLNLTNGTYNLGSATVGTAWPAWGTRNISAGTTVGYVSGVAQAVSITPSYQNLTFSGAGAKTPAIGALSIAGNWSVTGGAATLSTNNNSVTVTGNITGSGNITSGSGTITIGGNWTNNGTFTANTGTVTYNAAAGGQTVAGLTYYNLILSNTSGTNTASGSIVVNTGTMTTTAGGTLDMGTAYLLSGTGTFTNNGIIKTSVPTATSSTPIPGGKAWAGTIEYGALAGAQTIVSQTSYNNLMLDNTSGTNTAGGNLVVNGTLTTTAGGTLDMTAAYTLTGTLATITNNGTIRTQSLSATPLTTGKTWGGTVNYDAATGGQTIMAGTYNNLTLSNTSGTDTASGNLVVNSTLTTTAGGTLDMTAAYTLDGTLGTITNNGTIKTSVPTATSATPLPTGKTWGGTGTVEYAGATAQTMMQGTYNGNLTFSGAGAKTTESGTITVGGNWDVSGGTATLSANNTGMTVTGNITGSGAITSGSGTISLQGNWTNNGTFTAGAGTVNYAKTTGGQTVAGLTYNTLTLSNTSGTDTASGAITAATLNTTAGGTLDMVTYDLGVTNVMNNGTIRTQSLSATPLTIGKTWGGTVEYDAATGGQTIMTGTYYNLMLSNTSGTDTASGAITATTLNTTASGTLDMVTYDLGVTNVTNNGTIRTQNVSVTPLTTGKTWAGTVNYDAAFGGQTIMAGTYNNLTLSNSNWGTDTASGAITATTLNTTADGFLDMVTYDLGVTNVTNNGVILTQSLSATPLTSGKTWGGIVNYNAANGGQTIMAGTYNSLVLGNSLSGTDTASGAITATDLQVPANDILDMVTYDLAVTNVTNSGTIKTQSLSATPLTTGKTWGGTVNYDAATGAQTIMAGTYGILTLSNTSGTDTASEAITATTLNTTASGTLNMVIYDLGVTNVTNNGTIRTQSVSATLLTTGKTWAGTVNYDAATGGQTVMAGTYNNLTLSNTSGTDTASGNLVVNGTLTTTAGGTLDMTAAYTLDGTLGTIINNGTIKTSVPTATSATPLASGKTWGGIGTVEYAAATAQTVMPGTYNNLVFSGAGVKTAAGNITVGGNLTISAGTLTMSGSPTLYVYGNWSNAGAFVAGSSVVVFRGTSQSDITGTTSFYDLTIDTTTNGAKTVRFGAGETTTVTNTLIITGAAGKILTINSTDGTNFATLTIAASIGSGVDYVNVSHNHITGPNTITVGTNSTLVVDYTGWNSGTITLTVTVTADNKVYDGNDTASVTLFDDRIPGDVFTVSYTTALFSDRNVTDGKTVTVSGLSISGVDAYKYTLASTTAITTADITVRSITVKAGTDTKEYDGNTTSDGTPTVTVGSLVGGDTIGAMTQTFD